MGRVRRRAPRPRTRWAPTRCAPAPTTSNNPAPCSFHQTSLDQVIGKGKPVIAMFATPARCQSRYCGPVLDQLIAVAPEYQDRITPIHVEIYKDLTSNDLVTATETWLGFSGEPWIFAMDGERQGHRPAERRVRDRRDPHPHRPDASPDRPLTLLGTLRPLMMCVSVPRTVGRGGVVGEGLAAAAGALGVRVRDVEPGALEAVLVVERPTGEVLERRRVDDHGDPAVLVLDVVVGLVGVEVHLVAEAGAPAGAHGDPQRQVRGVLGLDQALHLRGRGVGERELLAGVGQAETGHGCFRPPGE